MNFQYCSQQISLGDLLYIELQHYRLAYDGCYLVNKPLPAAGISADNVRG